MYGRTLLRDLTWKKQYLTTAEICCSMEISASTVTRRVFTTLENGMDASPTERQSIGTVFLLDDGPQRSTSVFCPLSFSLFFVIYMFIWRQHDSAFLNALSADSGSVGRHEYSSESSAKKVIVCAELINKVCQLPSVKRKEKRTEHRAQRNSTKSMSCKDLLWPA